MLSSVLHIYKEKKERVGREMIDSIGRSLGTFFLCPLIALVYTDSLEPGVALALQSGQTHLQRSPVTAIVPVSSF